MATHRKRPDPKKDRTYYADAPPNPANAGSERPSRLTNDHTYDIPSEYRMPAGHAEAKYPKFKDPEAKDSDVKDFEFKGRTSDGVAIHVKLGLLTRWKRPERPPVDEERRAYYANYRPDPNDPSQHRPRIRHGTFMVHFSQNEAKDPPKHIVPKPTNGDEVVHIGKAGGVQVLDLGGDRNVYIECTNGDAMDSTIGPAVRQHLEKKPWIVDEHGANRCLIRCLPKEL